MNSASYPQPPSDERIADEARKFVLANANPILHPTLTALFENEEWKQGFGLFSRVIAGAYANDDLWRANPSPANVKPLVEALIELLRAYQALLELSTTLMLRRTQGGVQ